MLTHIRKIEIVIIRGRYCIYSCTFMEIKNKMDEKMFYAVCENV